ncbi:Protein of unknown function (DUF3077) [Pseudomonas sp. GV085]|nr:Protein of unknown function (DUF3077) [Pseudomonas sp. GV085]
MTEQSGYNHRSDIRWLWLLIFSFSPKRYARHNDRHARTAHYLTSLSKALVDDAVKVLTRNRTCTPASRQAGVKAEG